FVDPLEIERDLTEAIEPGSQALRLRSGEERRTSLEESHRELGPIKISLLTAGKGVEDLAQRAISRQVDFEQDPCSASCLAVSHRHVLAWIVHAPAVAATFELELIGGLRGKEDALAAVALGEARPLALRELGDRRKVVGQTEFLTYSTEDSDAVVDDFHDQR